MQHPNVEEVRDWFRIVWYEVFLHVPLGEASPVNGDLDIFQLIGFGSSTREGDNVVGQRKPLGHAPGGVMIAMNDKHGDVMAPELRHLLTKEQTRMKIFPIIIEDVSGQKHKIHGLIYPSVH